MSSSRNSEDHSNRQHRIGQRFEDQAVSFLEQQGFEIIERNWRASHKEIDIIARKKSLLVFVEVKASMTSSFGHPAERVTPAKMKNLSEAAQRYVLERGISGCDLRFDVITFSDGRLEHYPDAFPFTE